MTIPLQCEFDKGIRVLWVCKIGFLLFSLQ